MEYVSFNFPTIKIVKCLGTFGVMYLLYINGNLECTYNTKDDLVNRLSLLCLNEVNAI